MQTLKILAALLHYPEQELQTAAPELRALVAADPLLRESERRGLAGFVTRLQEGDLQSEYVATFDRGRKLSLHLFEHVHGESRDRGQAMVDLLAQYRAIGLELAVRELPDYLPLFLEYCSLLPEEVLAPLCEAPERFAALAREHSSCPSRESGGSLGQISRGQTVPEFEAYVARMKEGEIAPEPVETPYVYHIIYLHRRLRGDPQPLERVEQRIRDYLRESVMRRAVSQYVRLLVGKARIEGFDMAGTETPLVQ